MSANCCDDGSIVRWEYDYYDDDLVACRIWLDADENIVRKEYL